MDTQSVNLAGYSASPNIIDIRYLYLKRIDI